MHRTSQASAAPTDIADEEEFLASYVADAYPRPSVAVDVVLLTITEIRLQTLLLRRSAQPAAGRWSLPGGFVRIDESLDAAARRVLATKARLEGVFTEQLYTFGDPARDPRTRVISVAYYALVDASTLNAAIAEALAAGKADLALAEVIVPWSGERGGPVSVAGFGGAELDLAFDHASILGAAVLRLRGKVGYAPLGFELLPERFTLLDLRRIHEAILGRPINKDSFRRRVLEAGLVAATGERAVGLGHRPPELYRFVAREAA